MSSETIEWLNTNVLIGFAEKRGDAWHRLKGSDNHYPGAIPVDDVRRRLFFWEPVVMERTCLCGCSRVDKDIVRSDNRHRMGVFREGYRPHPYGEWLLEVTSNILGDSLHIGSAGLLKQGAQAWVQIEMPDNVKTPEGVEYRPNLLATTSFDGSIATTYKRTVTIVVCDNTRAMALKERGQQVKYRHTKDSLVKIEAAREALAIVHEISAEFDREVKTLCEMTVTDADWFRFLDAYIAKDEKDGKRTPQTARGRKKAETQRQNKIDDLTHMYREDPRCSPWVGTAFGALQAIDTFRRFPETIRQGTIAAERVMLGTAGNAWDTDNRQALDILATIVGTRTPELVAA